MIVVGCRRSALFVGLSMLAAAVAPGVAAEEIGAEAGRYYAVIGIGCEPWRPDGGSLAWRPRADGVEETEALRLFKHFEGSDTRSCLARIVDGDRELAAALGDLSAETSPERFEELVRAVHQRWTDFGVHDAMAEVATDGRRGPLTEDLLRRCEQIEPRRAAERSRP
jgi:hypothetical protein